MTMPALAPVAATPNLRLVRGGAPRTSWWERRAAMRTVVGGCPDHWWKPTGPTTAACTCDRF